jgi:hypothetical protein
VTNNAAITIARAAMIQNRFTTHLQWAATTQTPYRARGPAFVQAGLRQTRHGPDSMPRSQPRTGEAWDRFRQARARTSAHRILRGEQKQRHGSSSAPTFPLCRDHDVSLIEAGKTLVDCARKMVRARDDRDA